MSLIILEGKIDVASIPNPPSGSLYLAYDLDGTLKQKNDAGVVISVAGSLPLSNVLAIGNSTGTNSIILNTNSTIKSQVGQSELRLDSGNVILSVDANALLDSFLYLGSGGNITLGNGTSYLNTSTSNIRLSYNANNYFNITGTQAILNLNSKKVLEFGNGITSGSGVKYSAIISSDSSTILNGVVNSVVLGGTSITANQSNSVYVDNFYIKSGVVRNTSSTNTLKLNSFNESYIDSNFGVIGMVDGHTTLSSNGILIYDGNYTITSSSPNIDSNIIFVGTRNATGASSVKNTIVIGGINMVGLNSNTVYLGNTVNINNKYTLPSVDGASGRILKTDGAGNVSWSTIDGQSLTLTGLTVSGVANIASLNFNYLNVIGLTVSGTASFNNVSVPYLNITGITAASASFTNLGATAATFGSLLVNTLTLNQLNSNTIFITSITASNGNFGTISSTYITATTATISTINSTTVNAGIGIFATTSVNNSSIGGLVVNSATVSGNLNVLSNETISGNLTVLGTASISKISTLSSNNNATKLVGISGSQLVEVSTFVNSVTSSNGSVKISPTGSNYGYDFTIGFTSSNNTIQLSSISPGQYNLEIADIKKQGSYIYSASQSAIAHTGGTGSTTLTNNGVGEFTVSYAPTGLTAAVWNTGTNRFNFSQMTLGDRVNIQIDMDITTSTTDQEIEIYLVLAEGSLSEYQLTLANSGLLKRNATYPFVTNAGVLINVAAVRDNPAKLIFKSTSNATILVKGWYVTVNRY